MSMYEEKRVQLVLDRFKHDDPHRKLRALKAFGCHDGRVAVAIQLEVTDVDTGEESFVNRQQILREGPGDDDIARAVKELFYKSVCHEVDEFLRFDDRRVTPVHGESRG